MIDKNLSKLDIKHQDIWEAAEKLVNIYPVDFVSFAVKDHFTGVIRYLTRNFFYKKMENCEIPIRN